MNNGIFERLKESLSRQKQGLTEWLTGAPPQVREIRLGPAGENGLQTHLSTLEVALQKLDDKSLGLCDVCHDYVETSRLEMDYTACVCLSHLTGEEKTRLEYDLELSQKVQRALLPHTVPEIRGLEIAAFSQPARIVGGDYFDFPKFGNGAHGIIIADVMGKGMPASLLMASLQASLRIIVPESRGPAEAVTRLNRLFSHNIQLTKFVTLFLGSFDERSRVLTYSNAGHNPPLLLRHDGKVEHLLPTGAAVGLVENAQFTETSTHLQGGDQMLLYTDGVVESMNQAREQFGQERLDELMMRSKAVVPARLIGTLRETLQQFSGTTTPADDTTIIAVSVR